MFFFCIEIQRVLFILFLSLIAIRFIFLLLNFTSYLFVHFTAIFFAAEALVFASSYNGASAQASSNLMFLEDNDLSRAVAPFLPRGGEAPVNLQEERPLTMEEQERLALILQYQEQIGVLLKTLDATSVWNKHFAEESNEDLAAATLLHKDEDTHDPDKLWVVREGLLRNQNSSRYYFRAVEWVKTERQVRNGELPITFIIDDDGEG
jgi:hypothetical protein